MANAAIDRRVEVIDPANDTGVVIHRISDLRPLPFVVLLGEPGIGKSTVLGAEAEWEHATLVTVRKLMTGLDLVPGATLFLDALDEHRTDGQPSDKVHGLAHAIARLRPARWRLSCRSEDWRKGADLSPVRDTTGGAPIVVAQLLPLNFWEAAAVLSSLGEAAPEAFLRRAEALGAGAFTENPLSLRLFHKAVAGGGSWPTTRYEVFDSAVSRLLFEWNDERKLTDRRAPGEIRIAAAKASLILLTSGAGAIWRSNAQPPAGDDPRAYVTAYDLGIDRPLLNDTLDTPLFRGDGEAFEPLHRTIAEYLAGEALAKAVADTNGHTAALPLSRAIALLSGADDIPPTELRGVYAWFSAHLSVLGDANGASRLSETDAVTVLAYGDAAVFDTPTRRAILANLDRNDPYFLVSQVGITAVAGLAGEDLADDFTAILTGPPDGTHRLATVFDALTTGQCVLSLRPLLRTITLDSTRNEWQRRRAAEAYINGVEDAGRECRELLDALASEPVSLGREVLRAQLLARLPAGGLLAADVSSVLAAYEQLPEDHTVGRLYSLNRRLEAEPLPELFDTPTALWRPELPHRGHRAEVEHLLDDVLARTIKNTADLSASRLWRWTVHVRDYVSSHLGDQSQKALNAWLDTVPEREVAFFDAILAEDDPKKGPWSVAHAFATVVRRHPSPIVVENLLIEACREPRKPKKRLLAIAVDIARRPGADITAYWRTYEVVARLRGCKKLLQHLSVEIIHPWRLKQQKRQEQARRRDALVASSNVKKIVPDLAEMRSGQTAHHLDWAALLYFEPHRDRSGCPAGIARVIHFSDETTAEAILAGWKHLATNGFGEITAAQLGEAEAKSFRYHVEAGALAGTDWLISMDQPPSLSTTPIVVAIAVLKASFFVSDEGQRQRVERWALNRLNSEPDAGAAQLVDFWLAALDAGATRLSGFWRLVDEDARGEAIDRAVASILAVRPNLPPDALSPALIAAIRCVSRPCLLALANSALDNTNVTGVQHNIWRFVGFALDSPNHREWFMGEEFAGDVAASYDEALGEELMRAFYSYPGFPKRDWDTIAVQRLGRIANPEDDQANGFVTQPQRLSRRVGAAIEAIAADSTVEAGNTLSDLVTDENLQPWRSRIRHAQAQQARLRRDQSFKHPSPASVRAAVAGGPPVNARDLRAVVVEELGRLRSELRTTDTTPWKRYWNVAPSGDVVRPLIENECRDHLLDRLRDRLAKYRITAAVPEARRGEGTRADMLILTGAGRNLPIEAKRHFHRDIWTAASTQLQGYTADPNADGFGIYLVFWFGNDVEPTPARSDGGPGPFCAAELQRMLISDLPTPLQAQTDVIVFDLSTASPRAGKPRRKRVT